MRRRDPYRCFAKTDPFFTGAVEHPADRSSPELPYREPVFSLRQRTLDRRRRRWNSKAETFPGYTLDFGKFPFSLDWRRGKEFVCTETHSCAGDEIVYRSGFGGNHRDCSGRFLGNRPVFFLCFGSFFGIWKKYRYLEQ